MPQYRLLFVIVFAWFAILFNIERVDIGGQEPFDLDTLVYVLSFAISMFVVAFPHFVRRSHWWLNVAVLVVYAMIRLYIRTGWLDQPATIIIMEILALTITTLLMRRVADALMNFEEMLEIFLLDIKGVQMLPTTEGAERVNQELYRARRFERPVALVYCEMMSDGQPTQPAQVKIGHIDWRITAAFKERFQQVELAKVIASLTYRGDIIVNHKGGVVACLPETKAREAKIFARQLSELARSTMGCTINVGIAAFPDDGLIFEDLVRSAQQNMQTKIEIDKPGEDATSEDPAREGDVWVGTEERLKLNSELHWLNRLASQSYQSRETYLVFKRVVDILVVFCVLPLILPLFLVISLLIYLEDRGSVFFIQERTGYGGHKFKMYKFRTMIENAPGLVPRKVLMADGSTRYQWPDKTGADPRITRIGRILRRTSLDELPQLFNVFAGDMSLVGPRPTSWWLDKYTLHQTERLNVKPGITGLWQVCARETRNFDEWLMWDLRYVDKISFQLDVQIIWRTFAEVFRRSGV
jgi:lipopolysaccharide/colanic/teichoic acid biosynthesis glycosyltransferase